MERIKIFSRGRWLCLSCMTVIMVNPADIRKTGVLNIPMVKLARIIKNSRIPI
jgi:hypothetical protein